ncbi:Calx-beta domain-containing protein [Capilliphycus salinus ALCB114379]|uniref:Calx-beta domain-containing protein n=1 Tax=Capilliphycus salinus TaxID=2768948 RepID=UPI0039A4D57D
MTVIGLDSRQVITTFGVFPFSTVTTVDIQTPIGPGYGTGITISPNHIITAGHNVYDTQNNQTANQLRTTISVNENALNSRDIGNPNDPPANVTSVNFLASYRNTEQPEDDIALFTTSDAPLTANNVVGLIAFVNPESAEGLTIDTGGYPGDNVESNIPGNSGVRGRDLVRSPGTADSPGEIEDTSGRRFFYSSDVDTFGGQSGSGVWHTLEGDSIPRVLGVHTQGVISSGDSFIDFILGKRNSGVLITTDIYDMIVAQMEADSGTTNANDLPENAIIGSDSSFFSFLGLDNSGNDTIRGSYRKERIIGRGGDDRIFGGGANDRLEGGDGVDQALFSDLFTNYSFNITDPTQQAFEFEHTGGSGADGTDTTQDIEFGVFEFVDSDKDGRDDDNNLFFVPLQVDPNDDTKLKDGPEITPEVDILDSQNNKIGSITVESPAWMFDGDVDYTLTLGSELDTLFNFAYIIDVSGSVRGRPLREAQNAYITLTNSLIDRGVANNSRFAVIPFSSSASLLGPLDPDETIASIQDLSAGGSTNFNAALAEATEFFSELGVSGTSNIAYFLSDGDPTTGGSNFRDNAADLQSVADVRAFGIGSVDINNLNIIDSDSAEFLSDPSDLDDAFTAATIDRNTIERIDVKLAGNIVDTITPEELIEDTLGLRFEGTLDGLEVTRTAENEIVFDVVFNNGTPTASLSYKITTGQEQVTQQTDEGTEVLTIFSVNQADFVGSPESERIIGNDLDNIIDGGDGNNTLIGNGGNDRFILSGRINLVDGGAGIDTVEINMDQAEVGEISKTGNIINIGSDITLLNVEFIEFSDVRFSADTLAVTPTLSLTETAISITEGDSDSNQAIFTINLSDAAPEDVVIDFTTRSNNADAGDDFVEMTGQLVIAEGETSGQIAVEILDDADVEGNELIYLDLTVISGSTFSDGSIEKSAGINIVDNDSTITVPIIADDLTVIEGDPNFESTLTLTLERFGSLSERDSIQVEVVPAGSNPAQASDFLNGFSSIEVTFAPDESIKIVDIPITPDEEIEESETFGVKLTKVSGSASISNEEIIFTILDEDILGDAANDQNTNFTIINSEPEQPSDSDTIINPSDNDDELIGTDSRETLDGFLGNDTIFGLGGEDNLLGGAGNDVLYGNPGRDLLDGGEDNDLLFGGKEDDTLVGNTNSDVLYGDLGNDWHNGNQGADQILGGEGEDTLYGGKDNDSLVGGRGSDILYGDRGNDTLVGVDSNTSSAGLDEIDTLIGGEDADIYVLGDSIQSYYKDEVSSGFDDYAVIRDFEVTQDMIQLKGNLEDYRFDNQPGGSTALFYQANGQEDLIAVIEGISSSDLDEQSFSFV